MITYRYVLLSLMVLIPSSSFSIYPLIEKRIAIGDASYAELELGVRASLKIALQHKAQISSPGGKDWLSAMQKLAYKEGNAAIDLAVYFGKKNRDKYLYWLNVAAKNHSLDAVEKLADFYYGESDYVKALAIIDDQVVASDSLRLLKAKLLLATEKTEQLPELYQQFSDPQVRDPLFKQLSRYAVFEQIKNKNRSLDSLDIPSNDKNYHNVYQKSCRQKITLVATNFEDLSHLDNVLIQLSEHKLGHYICADNVIYQPLSKLNCQYEPEQPIMCDEQYWRTQKPMIESEYIGVMLPTGGANVHFGIMYFDRQDSFQVFTHELSHLLGFVDEYKVPSSHVVCQEPSGIKGLNASLLPSYYPKAFKETFGSPSQEKLRSNILSKLAWKESIHETTRLMQDGGERWVIGTPEYDKDKVGLFISETCDVNRLASFKPLHQLTSLRNTDVDMPSEYLSLLANSDNQYVMPPYYYNVALSLFQADKEVEAKKWLKLARLKEVNNSN